MPKRSDDNSFVPDDEQLAPSDQIAEDDAEGAESTEGVAEAPGIDDSSGQGELSGVESLQAELDAARDRVLRVQAELENYRKRAQRTLEDERRYACLPLMRDLLTVVDNLQRAIDAAQQNEGAAGLLEGVTMVAEQLRLILKQHHCEEIPADNARFDPNLHEAIAQFPSEEHEPGQVTQVTQTGYQLHDRVIRPSQVIVAAPRPDAEE